MKKMTRLQTQLENDILTLVDDSPDLTRLNIQAIAMRIALKYDLTLDVENNRVNEADLWVV